MTNLETAKVLFGIVLDRLGSSFPAAFHLLSRHVWDDFQSLAGQGEMVLPDRIRTRRRSVSEASEQEAEEYLRGILLWMEKDGFIYSDPNNVFTYDYVLSSKGLTFLNSRLDAEDTSLADRLSRLLESVGSQTSGIAIARAIDKAFDALQGIG